METETDSAEVKGSPAIDVMLNDDIKDDDGGAGADNITVNAGVTVEVTGASSDLIFRSGDQIIVNATAIAQSTGSGGNVTLISGFADTDNDGSMTLNGTVLANTTPDCWSTLSPLAVFVPSAVFLQ